MMVKEKSTEMTNQVLLKYIQCTLLTAVCINALGCASVREKLFGHRKYTSPSSSESIYSEEVPQEIHEQQIDQPPSLEGPSLPQADRRADQSGFPYQQSSTQSMNQLRAEVASIEADILRKERSLLIRMGETTPETENQIAQIDAEILKRERELIQAKTELSKSEQQPQADAVKEAPVESPKRATLKSKVALPLWKKALVYTHLMSDPNKEESSLITKDIDSAIEKSAKQFNELENRPLQQEKVIASLPQKDTESPLLAQEGRYSVDPTEEPTQELSSQPLNRFETKDSAFDQIANLPPLKSFGSETTPIQAKDLEASKTIKNEAELASTNQANSKDPALELIEKSREQYELVGNYSAQITRRIKADDTSAQEDSLHVRYRKQPMAMHIGWDKDTQTGTHWLYSETNGNKKLQTWGPPNGTVRINMEVDPTSEDALSALKMPIEQVGIGAIISHCEQVASYQQENKTDNIKYFGLTRIEEYDSALHKIVITDDQTGDQLEYYFDTNTFLPIVAIAKDDQGQELMFEQYEDVSVNQASLNTPVAFDADALFRRR